mgnify:CR=1 FL=1|jgi:hypothetical protein
MLKLFEPQNKIQKDRQIIRDTDRRMAKYSRRGLISNVLIYTLCLLVEQNFIQHYQTLAIVLTCGLLLATAVRGYLLFRMEALYPRGPTAWRNRYFVATLIGAAWWGVMLSSVTLVMDMQGEAALMWLYTVVFFSTTAHAFAPYQRFLSVYQFLGIVPAACCTFFIGDFIGVFYGCILLLFYWILNHHCELIAKNYWDHLEAQFVLAKKTESIEEEKRDTIASAQLANDYLQLLTQRMQGLMESYQTGEGDAPPSPVTLASQRAAIEKIYRNVAEFHKVLNRELILQPRVFNVRHFLQSLVRSLVEQAESKGVELETALSPAVPSRLVSDPHRVGQIVLAMLRSGVQQCRGGDVMFVEVEFMREYEDSGELHVTIARQSLSGKRLPFMVDPERGVVADLELLLAKGMAEAMKGSMEINEIGSQDGKNIRLRLPLAVAEINARPEYHRLRHKGRQLLLVHSNPRWLDHKRLELDTMGFSVHTAGQFRKAQQMLEEAVRNGRAMDGVVFYAASGDEQPVQFCNDLLAHGDLKHIHQLVICSDIGRKFFSDRIAHQSPQIHFVAKPSGIFEFEISSATLFPSYESEEDNEPAQEDEHCRMIWIGLGKTFDRERWFADTALEIQHVGDLKQIPKLLDEGRYQLVVVEYSGAEDLEAISSVRTYEQKHRRESLLAIIGVGPAQAEPLLLEAGADHFIAAESLIGGDARELRYWADGRHH